MVSSSVRKLAFFVPDSDEQAFKTAFYQIVLLVFLCLCVAAAVAVFFLLQAFLKPILWAILCGTVLFPLKRRVSSSSKRWLRSLRKTGTPLLLGLLAVPWHFFEATADFAWQLVLNKAAILLFISYPTTQALIQVGFMSKFIQVAAALVRFVDSVTDVFSSFWFFPLAIAYTIVYVVWLWLRTSKSERVKPENQENSGESTAVTDNKALIQSDECTISRALTIPIWFFGFCVASQCFGPLRALVFLGLVLVTVLCVLGKMSLSSAAVAADSTTAAASASRSTSAEDRKPSILSLNRETETSASGSMESLSNQSEQKLGDMYLQWLAGGCIVLFCSIHVWLLQLLLLPLLFAIMKRFGEYFGIWAVIGDALSNFSNKWRQHIDAVTSTAVPPSIRQLFRVCFYGDQQIIGGLESSADILSSVAVMVCLLVGAIFLSVFFVFQVHSETSHLVSVTTDIVNRTLQDDTSTLRSWIADATNITDVESLNEQLNEYVESAYVHARMFIVSKIKELSPSTDPERTKVLELQAKMAVDRLYELWLSRGSKIKETAPASPANSKAVLDYVSHMDLDFATIGTQLVAILKENLSTVRSISDSVWGILQGLIGGILRFVLGFGFEVLNFVISTIVFLTVLYYLLATSEDQWKPLEWFSMLAPAGSAMGLADTSMNPFSQAIEDAISGVFILSMKMATFYGLYIWFLHSLFGLSVVFIPSCLACLFAVVPFLAPYWVCLPGTLELLLVEDSAISALIFFIAHLLPMMFVDAAFYQEVKGSHPYLTGLAVVGGLYWLGLEGAIIGPILLCCMLGLTTLYRNTLASGTGAAKSKVA